jgi:hypothetical protein
MKVVQKKPIQSLNAFRRHSNGGSNAALPLLYYPIRFLMVSAIIGLFVTTAIAQQKDTNKLPSDEKQIDLLFDRIMKTLPDAERSKVDSAASAQLLRHETRTTAAAAPAHEREIAPRVGAKRIEDLPPELRAQVERTINSMESRREERKAQFRENAREKH